MEPSRLVLLQCFGSNPALGAAAEALAAALGPALGLPAQVADQPLELPASAHYPGRGQWLASGLIAALEAAPAPAPAERPRLRLGLTDVDLFDTGLNFVFGEASPGRGAVVSTARLDEAFYGLEPAPEALRARRLLTEAVHELGHAVGLGHCAREDCVMWFRSGRRQLSCCRLAACCQWLAESDVLQTTRPRCHPYCSDTLAESDAKGPQLCGDCSEAFQAALSVEGCSADHLLLNSREE